jgi:indolepyruvate ferredoxin oxidoreductase beta subunit
VKALTDTCERVIEYDAAQLALDAGHPQTLNVVMLGTLSRMLPLTALEDVVAEHVSQKALDANIRGFKLGQRIFGVWFSDCAHESQCSHVHGPVEPLT